MQTSCKFWKFFGKNILLFLLCAALLAASCSCAATSVPKQGFTVVSSFYPVYLTVLNLTDGVDGVNAINLTPYTTGCLHDYQLTTNDLKTLEQADLFVISGAGMEIFVDKVLQNCPALPLVDASEDIIPLDGNPHTWLGLSNYIQYVKNITRGLSAADPDHAAQYQANETAYLTKIEALKAQTITLLSDLSSRDIIVFHEAFPYFAAEFDLNIVAAIEREPDEPPVARELAETVDLIRESGCHALFAEPGYSQAAIDIIARETGAQVYLLDPITDNRYDNKDAYLLAMEQNVKTLKEALA